MSTEGIPDHLEGFWLGPDGEVWRLLTYCAQPTMTLERIDGTDRRRGAVGAPCFDGFQRLYPRSNEVVALRAALRDAIANLDPATFPDYARWKALAEGHA